MIFHKYYQAGRTSNDSQNTKVVCISGQARSGKDTAAGMIKKELEISHNDRVLVIHNGDLLKFMCKALFGWNGEKDEKGRTLLQHVGTDVVRKQEPNFWVGFIIKVLQLFPDEWDYVLIPDLRFPNELSELENAGFPVCHIHITRSLGNGLTEEQRNHPSETALAGVAPDYTVVNDGNLNDLNQQLKDIIHNRCLIKMDT